jgi:serine/threonine-protein kinase RsbW
MNGTGGAVRRVIEAEVAAVDAACAELRDGMLRELSPADRFAIELLLREALTNAIFHGVREPRSSGIVYEVQTVPGGMAIRVADGGPGFNWRNWRETPPPVSEEYGFGMTILHRYANRVQFSNDGSEVELIRMLHKGRQR